MLGNSLFNARKEEGDTSVFWEKTSVIPTLFCRYHSKVALNDSVYKYKKKKRGGKHIHPTDYSLVSRRVYTRTIYAYRVV